MELVLLEVKAVSDVVEAVDIVMMEEKESGVVPPGA